MKTFKEYLEIIQEGKKDKQTKATKRGIIITNYGKSYIKDENLTFFINTKEDQGTLLNMKNQLRLNLEDNKSINSITINGISKKDFIDYLEDNPKDFFSIMCLNRKKTEITESPKNVITINFIQKDWDIPYNPYDGLSSDPYSELKDSQDRYYDESRKILAEGKIKNYKSMILDSSSKTGRNKTAEKLDKDAIKNSYSSRNKKHVYFVNNVKQNEMKSPKDIFIDVLELSRGKDILVKIWDFSESDFNKTIKYFSEPDIERIEDVYDSVSGGYLTFIVKRTQ